MRIVEYILVLSFVLMVAQSAAFAQNKVVIVPMQGGTADPNDVDLMPIVIPVEPEELEEPEEPEVGAEFLDQAIGKQLVFNKGWDTSIGHRTKIDPTVVISLRTLEPVFGYPGITYPANEIRHWGEQTYFNSPKKIYAKGALLIDRGDFAEGGVFEWSLNKQGYMSFHNIVRKDTGSQPWLQQWTDPVPGDKVWFFIMSNDERFSSNPITFTWP